MRRIFFGCLFLSLCWCGRDGVRRQEGAVEKSRIDQAKNQSEAKK
jgi:hypothetical protein